MLNNVFINYYKAFAQSADKTPIFAAACVLSLVLVGYFLLIVLFIKKRFLYDLTHIRGFNFYFGAMHILLVIFLFLYYKRKNPPAMALSYDASGAKRRTFWNILSGIILLLPYVILIGVLLP